MITGRRPLLPLWQDSKACPRSRRGSGKDGDRPACCLLIHCLRGEHTAQHYLMQSALHEFRCTLYKGALCIPCRLIELICLHLRTCQPASAVARPRGGGGACWLGQSTFIVRGVLPCNPAAGSAADAPRPAAERTASGSTLISASRESGGSC